jgi:hypothetical protein
MLEFVFGYEEGWRLGGIAYEQTVFADIMEYIKLSEKYQRVLLAVKKREIELLSTMKTFFGTSLLTIRDIRDMYPDTSLLTSHIHHVFTKVDDVARVIDDSLFLWKAAAAMVVLADLVPESELARGGTNFDKGEIEKEHGTLEELVKNFRVLYPSSLSHGRKKHKLTGTFLNRFGENFENMQKDEDGDIDFAYDFFFDHYDPDGIISTEENRTWSHGAILKDCTKRLSFGMESIVTLTEVMLFPKNKLNQRLLPPTTIVSKEDKTPFDFKLCIRSYVARGFADSVMQEALSGLVFDMKDVSRTPYNDLDVVSAINADTGLPVYRYNELKFKRGEFHNLVYSPVRIVAFRLLALNNADTDRQNRFERLHKKYMDLKRVVSLSCFVFNNIIETYRDVVQDDTNPKAEAEVDESLLRTRDDFDGEELYLPPPPPPPPQSQPPAAAPLRDDRYIKDCRKATIHFMRFLSMTWTSFFTTREQLCTEYHQLLSDLDKQTKLFSFIAKSDSASNKALPWMDFEDCASIGTRFLEKVIKFRTEARTEEAFMKYSDAFSDIFSETEDIPDVQKLSDMVVFAEKEKALIDSERIEL